MNIDTILGTAPRPTALQAKAALAMTLAVSEAIRELGSVPAAHLYARVMGKVDLAGFEAMIRTLKNTGLVSEAGDMLTWIGPMKGAR